MRFSTAASVALAAAPALVAAQDTEKGTLGFSVGTKKADGTCKFQADYEKDFESLSSNAGSKIVRGYDANDCNFAQQILPAAKSKGAKVVLGIWPDTTESYNNGVNAIKSNIAGFEEQVYGITVGSETLYRGTFTGQQLFDKIQEVQKMFPDTKVGTADSWNKFYDGTADAVVQGGVKFLLMNAFSFWQGTKVEDSFKTYYGDIWNATNHIMGIAGNTDGLDLWTGEVGWPGTGGTDYGEAKAGDQNAATNWKTAICPALNWNHNVFVFEAFDEPWKPDSKGDNGVTADEKHWGVMNADGKPKFDLHC